MRVRFVCGHSVSVDAAKAHSPVCACGEQRVARVLDAPLPRFRGVASGPLVEQANLPAVPVSFATKDETHG